MDFPSTIWSTTRAFIETIDPETLETDHHAAHVKIQHWNTDPTTKNNIRTQPNTRFRWNDTNPKEWEKWSQEIETQIQSSWPIPNSNKDIANRKWNIIR